MKTPAERAAQIQALLQDKSLDTQGLLFGIFRILAEAERYNVRAAQIFAWLEAYKPDVARDLDRRFPEPAE